MITAKKTKNGHVKRGFSGIGSFMKKKELQRVLDTRSESPNIEFKEGFVWSKDNNDARCRVAKTLLAMSNTKDGGAIIVGISEKPHFSIQGLSAEELISFDVTKVNDFIQKYTGPSVECVISKLTINNNDLVIIEIPEFKEFPIICKNNAASKENPKHLILKKGLIYIRNKTSCEEISGDLMMNELVGRALIKKAGILREMIDSVIKGRPNAARRKLNYKIKKDIKEAQIFLAKRKRGNSGTVRLVSYPYPVKAGQFPKSSMSNFLSEKQVRLRGHYFPHINSSPMYTYNFRKGKETTFEKDDYHETWRFYDNGLFVWQGDFWEDVFEKKTEEGNKTLGFIEFICQITEFLLFASRIYSVMPVQTSAHIEIRLTDCFNRQLKSFDWAYETTRDYISKESEVVGNIEINTKELETNYKQIAAEMLKNLFFSFNWEDPEGAIISWQNRLLERKL